MKATATEEPVFEPVPEPIGGPALPLPHAARLVGRVRVPVTLTVRPWARLYELPDGRRLWCVRLWEHGEVVTRCLAPSTLRRYARASGLRELERDLREVEEGPRGDLA